MYLKVDGKAGVQPFLEALDLTPTACEKRGACFEVKNMHLSGLACSSGGARHGMQKLVHYYIGIVSYVIFEAYDNLVLEVFRNMGPKHW